MIKIKLITKIFKRNDWYVTSPFGKRNPIKTKNGTSSNFHTGCDYGTNGEKWPQYAIENGEVLSCGVAKDGAKYIWINYPRINKKLLHYHLDSICVKKGQKVYEGLLIGYTGSTGKATGIHLHLGMKNSGGGDYENPHSYDYQINEITKSNKTIDELVREVINGKWGNGSERVKILTEAGYDAKEVQKNVNKELLKDQQNKKKQYVVQKGDTLSAIAKKYNTTYQKIYQRNKSIIGNNPNIIKPGQILDIE